MIPKLEGDENGFIFFLMVLIVVFLYVAYMIIETAY